MTSSLRPYWQTRPTRLRIFASVLLITFPLWFAPMCLVRLWPDVCEGIAGTVRELWRAIRLGGKA